MSGTHAGFINDEPEPSNFRTFGEVKQSRWNPTLMRNIAGACTGVSFVLAVLLVVVVSLKDDDESTNCTCPTMGPTMGPTVKPVVPTQAPLAPQPVTPTPTGSAEPTLYKILAMSRHSVRSSGLTEGDSKDGRYWYTNVTKDWGGGPRCNESKCLTFHGQLAAEKRGSWWEKLYGNMSVSPSDTTVYCDGSDVTMRECDTAIGFLRGFFGSDVYTPIQIPYMLADLSFLTTFNKSDYRCVVPNQQTVDGIIGSIDNVNEYLSPQLSFLGNVTDCCAPRICNNNPANCTLTELSNSFIPAMGMYFGPFLQGIQMDTHISMMYLNNMPWDAVAVGAGDFEEYYRKSFLGGATAKNLLISKHVTRAYASQMATHIVATLNQILYDQPTPGLNSSSTDRLVMYYVHGTQLTHMMNFLDLSFVSSNWGPNTIPPVGMLLFNIYEQHGSYFIRLEFEMQSPQQIRSASNLTTANPPERIFVAVLDCTEGPMNSCPAERFIGLLQSKTLRECTVSITDMWKGKF